VADLQISENVESVSITDTLVFTNQIKHDICSTSNIMSFIVANTP